MISGEFVIIGAGKTGLSTALDLVRNGKKVILIDQNGLGGSHYHTSEIPRAFVSEASHTFAQAVDICKSNKETFKTLTDYRSSIFSQIHNHIGKKLNELDEEIMTPNLEVIYGKATFTSKHLIEVTTQDKKVLIHFDECIIAVGKSGLKIPHVEGLDSGEFLFKHTIFNTPQTPTHLGIIGVNAESIEIADIYSSFGYKVTMFSEKASHQCMPELDQAVFNFTIKQLLRKQVSIHFRTKIRSIKYGKKETVITNQHDQKTKVSHIYAPVEEIFTDSGLNLKNIGIKFSRKGIATNGFGRSSHKHIWALGECSSQTNTLNKETIRENAINQLMIDSSRLLQQATKTPLIHAGHIELNLLQPLFNFGFTELSASARFGPQIKVQYSDQNSDHGFWKIIYRDTNDQVVGFAAAGKYAAEIKLYALIAVHRKLKREEVVRFLKLHQSN